MTKNKLNQKLNKAKNRRSTYNITGVAGEYFVAAELSRRGLIAIMTLKNTPNIDIISTNNFFIAFVDLKENNDKPDYFLIS